jgi:hypothetical protein
MRNCSPSDPRYLVTGYTGLAHLARSAMAGNVFLSRVQHWMIATWVLSLATQLGATLLIGYQIWKSILWNFQGIRASRLSILWILVESGALYSVTTLFLLGFSSTNIGDIFAKSLGQISVRAPLPSPLLRSLKRRLVAGAGSDADPRSRRAETIFFFGLNPGKRFHQ